MTTMQGIAALLQRTAMRSPDQLAVIDHGGRITYGALAEMADRLSRSMIGLGLERHDRVAVYLDKSIETVATIFAACAAGLVVVPINPKLKPHQVRHIVADSGAAALVTTRYRLQQLADAVDANAMKIILTTAGTEDIRSGVHSWSALAAAESPGRPHRCIDMDPSAILYTSGSTGMPKGVVVSHRNLILGAESVNAYLGTTREDVILSLLPLSFDAGLSQVTTATAAGAKLVLHNYIQAKEAVADCAAHGVTSITAVGGRGGASPQVARSGSSPIRAAICPHRCWPACAASFPAPSPFSCTASPRLFARHASIRARSIVARARSARRFPMPRSSCCVRMGAVATRVKAASSCIAAAW
jgi:acyl-CoA synthetase (AMP-forming)/AMP-acid ligase II